MVFGSWDFLLRFALQVPRYFKNLVIPAKAGIRYRCQKLNERQKTLKHSHFYPNQHTERSARLDSRLRGNDGEAIELVCSGENRPTSYHPPDYACRA